MKKTIWAIVNYTCISFTAVTVLFTLLAFAGTQRALTTTESLQLLLACALLSATQMVCTRVATIENRQWLRAIIHIGVLFTLGGLVFGWFASPWAFLTGAIVSLLAYALVNVFDAFKTRRDAREINEALRAQRGAAK